VEYTLADPPRVREISPTKAVAHEQLDDTERAWNWKTALDEVSEAEQKVHVVDHLVDVIAAAPAHAPWTAGPPPAPPPAASSTIHSSAGSNFGVTKRSTCIRPMARCRTPGGMTMQVPAATSTTSSSSCIRDPGSHSRK
jgi:hypothetical protein